MKTLRTCLNSPQSAACARGIALFLGGFALLGLLAKQRVPGFDPNLWWIDLRALPAWCADLLVGMLAVLLLAWGVCRRIGAVVHGALIGLLTFFMAVAFVNATVFWVLLAQGRIQSSLPIPLSLIFGAGLLFLALHVKRVVLSDLYLLRFAACAACALAFPLLQALGFGKTDYRRSADIAVVFGARAYADGRPSDALADRVRTACELYQQGLVRQLVFSGGPGDGAIHETESMRRLAVRLGVPASAIVRDEAGLNTAATLRNTRPLLAGRSAMAVSEFYHLPRIKLTAAVAGIDLLTVPARPVRWSRQLPLSNMLREIPAFWLYYGRALAGQL
jgi:vancomycin permeability regulator SanA